VSWEWPHNSIDIQSAVLILPCSEVMSLVSWFLSDGELLFELSPCHSHGYDHLPVVLSLRLWVMWENNRKVLIGMFTLFIGITLFQMVIGGTNYQSRVCTSYYTLSIHLEQPG
jgi:hypothetical protein